MSLDLRILLIGASVIMVLSVVLRIRKSKFQIRDGVFWFLLSALFLVMSIFPQAVIGLSRLIGIESPANLVFLGIIAIVLVKNFLLSAKISQLEYNLMKLTQHTMVESVSEAGKAKDEQEK
jgi:hypothetical protein